jgi:ABC-type multidrug transport system fused ATPase/permease subunit
MLDMLRKLAALFPARDRRDAAVLFVLMFLATGLEAFAVWSVYPLILALLNPTAIGSVPFLRVISNRLGNPAPEKMLVGLLAAVFLVYLVKNVYAAYVAWAQNRFAFDKQSALARRLFHLYLNQPYTFHMQRNSAELIRNMTGEADQLIWMVFLPGVILVAEGLITAALVTLLFIVQPLAALVIMGIFGGVGVTYMLLLRHRLTKWGEDRQYHDWKRILRIQEGLGGIKEVKILGREQYFLEQFMTHSEARSKSYTRFQLTAAMPLLVLEVTGMLSLVTVVLLALGLGWSIAAVVPFLGMVAAAAFRLVPASNRILLTFQQLRYGGPVVENLYEQFQLPLVEAGPRATASDAVFKRVLRLENLAFRYPDRPHDVFTSVDVEIARGQSVAIVGPSGSGKTTLVDLMLGLLEPAAGRITVDGRDIHTILPLWQSKIGYIPQHVYLSDESLRLNIAFGLPAEAIDEAALQRAIDQAQLRDLIASLPQGLETVIGERGVRLSGGQLQRVGIARALYNDPEVLVLDEATSALDSRTEAQIMDAIGKLRGEKTIIIIAHRLSTVEGCDVNLRVANGTVDVAAVV